MMIANIPVSKIDFGRKSHIRILGLEAKIIKDGIEQPFMVKDLGNGRYELLGSSARFQAAINVGLAEVPCSVELP